MSAVKSMFGCFHWNLHLLTHGKLGIAVCPFTHENIKFLMFIIGSKKHKIGTPEDKIH
jgi:hypothetical protein